MPSLSPYQDVTATYRKYKKFAIITIITTIIYKSQIIVQQCVQNI